jgi:protein-S-isoprenylcysteine O-methyltransferase Ste14
MSAVASPAIAFKTAAFLLAVPGTVAFAIPLALLWGFPDAEPLPLGAWRWFGVALFAAGAAVYIRCSVDFARFGQGIPAPVDSTKFLVSNGLYRHVRNPMYIAGSMCLFGEAIAWESRILLGYAAAVTACYHPAVVFLEEPALRKRFGESYERYCAAVPRWLPRLRATDVAKGGP